MARDGLNSTFSQKTSFFRGGSGFAANVIASLAATGFISLIGVLVVSFSHVKSTNAIAFRLLIVAAIISAVMASFGFFSQLVSSSRSAGWNRELVEQVALLAKRIPSIDWSYDTAEHARASYVRMREVVEDPRVLEFKVLTVFRDAKFDEISEAQRPVIRDYYHALENALQTRRGFNYERLVGLRSGFRNQPSARQLFVDLIAARPDFIEHFRKVMRQPRQAIGARAEFRFFGDTGRLLDLAFAVALDQHRVPLALLLEFAVSRPGDGNESEHPVLGLLTLENPNQQLADAFLLAHQALRSGSTSVERIGDDTIQDILGIR
jgi:hypothetical protein